MRSRAVCIDSYCQFQRACANAWIKNLPKGQQLAYPTLPHNPTPTSCEGTHADANPDADADADGYGDVNDDGNDDGDDVGNGDGDGDGVRDSDGKHNGSQSKKSQKADEDFRTNEFWKFVDHELILARTTVAEDNPTDLAARAEQWNAYVCIFSFLILADPPAARCKGSSSVT